MATIKTSELTGAALNWAVAQIEGWDKLHDVNHSIEWFRLHRPKYSTDWSEGGPIIEREELGVWPSHDGVGWSSAPKSFMTVDLDSPEFIDMGMPLQGDEPLIAAMRCFVASEWGDSVDIPEELQP